MTNHVAAYANQHGADLDESAAFERWFRNYFVVATTELMSVAQAFRAWQSARSYMPWNGSITGTEANG